MLEAYLEGDGGTFYFGDGDFFSEQMKKDPFIRRVVGAQIAAGKFEGWTRKSYQGAGGKVIAAGDVGSGNWERAALGSYKLEWSTDGAVKDGVAQVTIHITNKMTNSSIAHFVGYGGKAHAWVTNQLSKVNHAPALTTDLLFTMNIPVG